MSEFSSQERQTLINMYVTQYNQTNLHIERLFDTLDDIRNNINNLIGNNMTSSNRFFNRSYRNNNNRNRNTNGRRPYIYYDLSNPIDRSTYISDETNNNNNNQDITDFLTTFLNSTVPVRPSQEQINNASRLVRYSEISNPNSTSCVISLEPFESNDNVRQLHHCGHIFFPDQFNQWFSNHVRCPVCRHDIRNYTNATNVQEIPEALDISNNELPDNLLSTISNRLFSSLLNPSSSNPSDRFVYDPSNNVLLFETILRANNQQT